MFSASDVLPEAVLSPNTSDGPVVRPTMKVVFVVQRLAGLKAGAERWCIELGDELQDRGHEVSIVTFETSSAPPAFPSRVPVRNLVPRPVRSFLSAVDLDSNGYGRSPVAETIRRGGLVGSAAWHAAHGSFGLALAGWLARNSPNVAVGVMPSGITALHKATRLNRGHRPRLVASLHSKPSVELGGVGEIRRKHNVAALAAMDAIHVLNEDFVRDLPSETRDRAVAIPNPVKRLSPAPGRPREPVILGVGRLVPLKAYDKLIDAFALIRDQVPGWTVEIFGDGPEAERLAQRIVDRGLEGLVSLKGGVSDIGAQYDRASIMAHPSEYEGHPLTVSEAIMHGLPVVGFADTSGVNTLVVQESTGRLSAPGVEAFGQTLLSLIHEPIAAAGLERGRSVLAEQYRPDKVYDQLEQLLAISNRCSSYR